jgi:hypothetical protein
MNEPSPTEESLRQFLLGAVDDAERERIEGLFLTDPRCKELLQAAEQSLLDDYLEERLAPDERESFLLRYGASPGQQQQLRIAKLIKEYAEAHSVVRPVDSVAILKRSRFSVFHDKSKLIWSIAAVLVAALLLTVWIQSRRNKPDAQHLAIERELATLNDPSRQSEALPGTTVLSVAPITLRNVEGQASFTLRPDIRVLELHLLAESIEQPGTYQAILSRGPDSEKFSFPELPTPTDKPRVIRLKVPTSILSPGDYQVHLSSIAANRITSVEEYSFRVGR